MEQYKLGPDVSRPSRIDAANAAGRRQRHLTYISCQGIYVRRPEHWVNVWHFTKNRARSVSHAGPWTMDDLLGGGEFSCSGCGRPRHDGACRSVEPGV